MCQKHKLVSSWTNGSKSEVFLLQDKNGNMLIKKCYRKGLFHILAREYIALKSLSSLDFVPKIVELRFFSREMALSYVPGTRVLEWILEKYGRPGLDLKRFGSFHGLEINEEISEAFRYFRDAKDSASTSLKEAIRSSYLTLHSKGWIHGDPSPRNLIYEGGKIYLIDFDHARPCLDPPKIDYRSIEKWYGLKRNTST